MKKTFVVTARLAQSPTQWWCWEALVDMWIHVGAAKQKKSWCSKYQPYKNVSNNVVNSRKVAQNGKRGETALLRCCQLLLRLVFEMTVGSFTINWSLLSE